MVVKILNIDESVIVAIHVVFHIVGIGAKMLDEKRLIQNLQKRHRPSEEFSSKGLSKLVIVTEGNTPKGVGILEHIWEISEANTEAVWISEDCICIFVKPDSALISNKLDRYANLIKPDPKAEPVVKIKSEKERLRDIVARKKRGLKSA